MKMGINCGHCKYFNAADKTCATVVGDIQPGDYCKIFEAVKPQVTKRIVIMHSNDNGTINFNKSFASWMQKEKDPLTTKESFVTLNNEAARQAEHEQLLREYGFPSEQSFETMRYVPVVEVETDDDGVPIHNLPPWVVNEAGEALGDRLDEDAPDYDKSDKAKARKKAGSAQKMFYDFMEIEKAPFGGFGPGTLQETQRELRENYKQEQDTKKQADRASSRKRRGPGARLSRLFARTRRDAPGRVKAARDRAQEVIGRKSDAAGRRVGRGIRGAYEGLVKPGDRPRPGSMDDIGAGSERGGQKVGMFTRRQLGRGRRGTAGYIGGLFGTGDDKDKERSYRRPDLAFADQEGGYLGPVDDTAGRRGRGAVIGTRKFFRGFGRGSAPGQGGREFADRTQTEDEGLSEKIGYGAGTAVRGLSRWGGNVATTGGRAARDVSRAAVAGRNARREQAGIHRDMGIGEGRIFSHPDFHGLDHAQRRTQVRTSISNRGNKTLAEHLMNYSHLAGEYPVTDDNGEAGDKIGHVTVNSLPKGHHAGTMMNNDEFHSLIQAGNIGFQPTPEHETSNWQQHIRSAASFYRDPSHMPPAAAGAEENKLQIGGLKTEQQPAQQTAQPATQQTAQPTVQPTNQPNMVQSSSSSGTTSNRPIGQPPGYRGDESYKSTQKSLFKIAKAFGVRKYVNR